MGQLNPTAYSLLGIHPSAPAELADAAYWRAVIALQRQRTADADSAIYAITRAFETLSNAQRRADYDLSIGYQSEPLISSRSLQLRQSVFSRILRRGSAMAPVIDYYEVIGLDDSAPSDWVPDARQIMRDYYLKAPDNRRRAVLLSLLDEACTVIFDAQRRAQYDAQRGLEAPPLRQKSRVNSDSLSSSSVQGAPDTLDDSMLAETKLPAVPSERSASRPESPSRIAPQVRTRQSRRPARIDAADDPTLKQQPNAPTEINGETSPATASGLPPRREPLLSSVVHLAGSTMTRSGRAVVVLGRAGATPIRGTTTFAANALRGRSRKHTSDRPASQARHEQPKNSAGSQKDVESILLGRLESTVRSEPSSHPPDEPTD